MAIYAFYRADGTLYKWDDNDKVDTLFEAVVTAINDCGILKPQLPQKEFVVPCRKYAAGDRGWREHFDNRDNRRFFLSDVHDYLTLFFILPARS